MSVLLIAGGILIVLLSIAGAPLFACVAAVGFAAFSLAGIDPAALIVELYRLAEFPALIAIPLFTFAGYILAESQAPRRFINFSQALFGWVPGGLAIVALCTTAVFTAFSGASGVTIIALGGMLYPSLIEHKYPERFSLGLLTTSGSLGLLFPPALPIILYGLVANLSIDTLFAAGFVPGVLLLLVLVLYSLRVGKRASVVRTPFSVHTVVHRLRDVAWELPLPILIVGGIYGGLFTAIEASAVTTFYAFIVEVLIRREVRITADLPRIIRESMVLVGAILVMLGCAMGLTNYIIDQEVPGKIFALINEYIGNKELFLIVLNLFLLSVNMLEVFSSIIIFVPIITPIAQKYGIEPIHLGIMFLLNLEIGYMIPPLALNLFLASHRFEKPLTVIYRAVIPFLLLLLAVLLLVSYVPEISMFLPHLLGKQ